MARGVVEYGRVRWRMEQQLPLASKRTTSMLHPPAELNRCVIGYTSA
eukprot:gene24157-9741_t